MSESLFERVARDAPFRAPPLLCTQAEWSVYCRKVWARFPAWGFDAAYLTEVARPFLPRIMAEMGFGRFCGFLADASGHGFYSRAIAGDAAPTVALPLFADGRWRMFRLEPNSPDFFALDDWSHAWFCRSLARRGESLLDLGAWRWGVSEAKAAHRIARLCGIRRPVP